MMMFIFGAACAAAIFVAIPNAGPWINAKVKSIFAKS